MVKVAPECSKLHAQDQDNATAANGIPASRTSFSAVHCADRAVLVSDSMRRLLSLSRKFAAPSAPEPVAAAAAVQQAPPRHRSVSPPPTPVRGSPVVPSSAEDTPEERRDSDEFFGQAIQELGDEDFLLSPEKVTTADINSIQGKIPLCGACAYLEAMSAHGSVALGHRDVLIWLHDCPSHNACL